MSELSRRKQLHADLVECRWLIMGQLADHYEEQGLPYMAKAWRFLRATRRWPSPRGRFKSQWGWNMAMTYGDVSRNPVFIEENGISRWRAQYSANLPSELRKLGLDLRYGTEIHALRAAAETIAAWLRLITWQE